MNDKDIFIENLYLQNYALLYRLIRISIYNTDDIKEVFQDVFLQATIQYTKLSKHENTTGWLVVTTKNIVKSYNRKYLKSCKYLLYDYDFDSLIQYNDELLEEVRYRELIENNIIYKAIKTLSSKERDLYRWKFVHNESLSEISEKLGISKLAVNTRVYALKKKIRKYIYAYEKNREN